MKIVTGRIIFEVDGIDRKEILVEEGEVMHLWTGIDREGEDCSVTIGFKEKNKFGIDRMRIEIPFELYEELRNKMRGEK